MDKWDMLKDFIRKNNQYIQGSGLYDTRDKITVGIWTNKILEEMEVLEGYEQEVLQS